MVQGKELFRKEAVDHAGQRALGHTMITQPLTTRFLSLILMAVTSITITFLYFGEYARRETVTGYLKPDGGISKIYPSAKGVAENLFVQEGQLVAKDQPLLMVRAPYSVASGEEVSDEILTELASQAAHLTQSMVREQQITNLDHKWQLARLAYLRDERSHLHRTQALQISRTKVTAQHLKAIQDLKRKGYVSDSQLFQSKTANLREQQELAQVARQITKIEAEIMNTHHRIETLPMASQEKLTSLEKEISSLRQKMTEIRARSNYLVTAPVAGVIAAVNVNIGEAIGDQRSILSILPQDSRLFAWLLIPSRAAGMAYDGQGVRLMYDGFPYQRFGTQSGTIISISDAAISPGELAGPLQIQEPVFVAKVALDKGTITAYGEERPLQTDMLLTADIVQAKRSILDWILDPLYALRGRT